MNKPETLERIIADMKTHVNRVQVMSAAEFTLWTDFVRRLSGAEGSAASEQDLCSACAKCGSPLTPVDQCGPCSLAKAQKTFGEDCETCRDGELWRELNWEVHEAATQMAARDTKIYQLETLLAAAQKNSSEATEDFCAEQDKATRLEEGIQAQLRSMEYGMPGSKAPRNIMDHLQGLLEPAKEQPSGETCNACDKPHDECHGCPSCDCCTYHVEGGNRDYCCGPTAPAEETERLRHLVCQLENSSEADITEAEVLQERHDALEELLSTLRMHLSLLGDNQPNERRRVFVRSCIDLLSEPGQEYHSAREFPHGTTKRPVNSLQEAVCVARERSHTHGLNSPRGCEVPWDSTDVLELASEALQRMMDASAKRHQLDELGNAVSFIIKHLRANQNQ